MIMVNIQGRRNKDNNLESLKIKVFDNNTQEVLRETKLKVGDHVLVDPLHPTKMKNRGRRGIIIGYHFNDIGGVEAVKVKFDDTNRSGKIEADELVPVENN